MIRSTSSPIQLPLATRPTRPWANGQGLSSPVTAGTASVVGDGPDWWVTIASISGDCHFSALIGIDRSFMPLDDVRLSLELDGLRTVAPHEVIEFAGEAAPRCLADGPTRALNLMVRRGRTGGVLDTLMIDGPTQVTVPSGGSLVVVNLEGTPRWPGADHPQPGDAAQQDSAQQDSGQQDSGQQDSGVGPEVLLLDGAGLVAVIRIG